MPTKIIHIKPLVFSTCEKCAYCEYVPYIKRVFSTKVWDLFFCTYARQFIKDLPKEHPKFKILKCSNDKESTYVFLETPQTIPSWCPLEDYEEKKNE